MQHRHPRHRNTIRHPRPRPLERLHATRAQFLESRQFAIADRMQPIPGDHLRHRVRLAPQAPGCCQQVSTSGFAGLRPRCAPSRSSGDAHLGHRWPSGLPPSRSSASLRDLLAVASDVFLRRRANRSDQRARWMLERRQSSWPVEVSTLPIVPRIDSSYLVHGFRHNLRHRARQRERQRIRADEASRA